MIKTDKIGASTLRTALMAVGIVLCLGAVTYSFFTIQEETGQEGQYKQVATELSSLARQITASVRDTELGQEATFVELKIQVAAFEEQLALMQAPELNQQVSVVDLNWQPIKRSAQSLVDSSSRIVFVKSVAAGLEKNARPMQQEFASVVKSLQGQRVSTETLIAAQKAPWLIERMARNIDRSLAGRGDIKLAADEFRSDAVEFIRIIEALTRGDKLTGIDRLSSSAAIDSMSNAFRLFSVVSTSADRIAEASTDLRQAALARRSTVDNSVALNDAIAALFPAIENLAVGRMYNRGTLMASVRGTGRARNCVCW